MGGSCPRSHRKWQRGDLNQGLTEDRSGGGLPGGWVPLELGGGLDGEEKDALTLMDPDTFPRPSGAPPLNPKGSLSPRTPLSPLETTQVQAWSRLPCVGTVVSPSRGVEEAQ